LSRFCSAVGESLMRDASSAKDLVLVAGGTGFAPMKAMIQQVAAEGGNRQVHLFWGVRWGWELYDIDALRELEKEHDWLQVTTCASIDTEFDGVRDTAAGGVLRAGPWPDHEVYVCGSPEMVRGSLDALGATVARDRIHIESFGSEEEQS
jgi:NAD(P)H-flavin reductase